MYYTIVVNSMADRSNKCGESTVEKEIENPGNGVSDRGSFGITGNAGYDCDECSDDDYIDMEVGSAKFWEAVSRTKLNMKRAESREFEFDMSGINAQAWKELESIVSPADELFYKGQLLPLHLPPRIQMVEKLLSSEILGIRTEDTKNISGTNSSEQRENSAEESAFFSTPYESCDVTPYDSCEVSQELKPDMYEATTGLRESYSNEASASTSMECKCNDEPKSKRRIPMLKKAKKLLDSTHSKQTAIAHKLKASRAFLKSIFSKTSNARGEDQEELCYHMTPLDDQADPQSDLVCKARGYIKRYMKVMKPGSANGSSVNIQREGYQVAAAVARSIHIENSYILAENHEINHRKSFSGSISSLKGSSSPLASKSNNSKPFNSSNQRASPTHSGVLLKRSMSTTNPDTESAIQGAIAHCKQSHLSDSKNMINTSKYLQRPTSNTEGLFADTHVHGRPRSGSRIVVCDQAGKPGLCRG